MISSALMRGAVAAVAIAALASCGNGGSSAPAGTTSEQIAIDGSSTVFPLAEAAAETFTNTQTGAARVTVGESGTGGGFGKFCRGETQISNASRPISTDEIAACAAANIQFIEIPIAFDGISVVVHPSNPLTNITMAELRHAWEPAAERTVTQWRQVNAQGPNTTLQLYGPGTASGTFDYFNEAVNGDGGASRTDYTPSEDDNVVVQGVASNPGAMGYFGYAYYEQNRERVKALSINGVAPSPETIASGAYPLSRPMFIYVNAESLRRPQVRRFVNYFLENAATLAPRVGYVPLPAAAYAAYTQRVADNHTGTAFGGHNEVGLSIGELLARPLADEAAPSH
ncbi:PstS family phosphate ABC transporter substrate-binding protein [Candidatus Viadribacter manganicus]|uniref:Phosphate-binding protein n=1 Tax=Candidatus Viadribacter manganicus TaxID=1759059 RepID=A0A1B1AM28_9PROT|nr:PstS family phosphate ABC transporter substrate-binding protein [Candidatus Viadribacter manganicus]ANP47604.1 protein sphX [Candidatus Viadribacter manganicus]